MADKEQTEAIAYDQGPALILAGPGSGKTFVLTHHIKYLIEKGYSPESILVITFTKKAATEMKGRFERLLPDAANRVVFGTFHSVFFRIIKIFQNVSYEIISNEKRLELLLSIVPSFEEASELGNQISRYKASINHDKFNFSSDGEREEFLKEYDFYNDYLFENKLIDFDDILIIFNEILENKDILKALQKQFKYVCIDEFQDINEVQYKALYTMFKTSGNIFCVGDEDQSIYGFRGSNIFIMRRFLDDFKDCRIIELKNNYRSGMDIMTASDSVISKNSNRLKKCRQICNRKDVYDDFHLNFFETFDDEFEALKNDISCSLEKNMQCALLLRTNDEVKIYEDLLFLKESNILLGTIKNTIISDLINYILYVKRKDLNALYEILNVPDRKVTKNIAFLNEGNLEKTCKNLYGTMQGQNLSILLNHVKVMEKLNNYSFTMYFKNILGHEAYIIKKYQTVKKETLEKIYDEILLTAKKSTNFDIYIDNLKREYKVIKDSKYKKNKNLLITTYHQSKGLEFDAVFLPDVYEGKVPLGISVYECEIEEERRLFYVAMTRAKNNLFIYSIKNEESGGKLPSRFLKDLY